MRGEKSEFGEVGGRRGRAFNHRCQFNEGTFEKQSSVAQKTTEKKQVHTMADRVLLVLLLFVCVCVPLSGHTEP